jgi:CheY-like chemotaxis protein
MTGESKPNPTAMIIDDNYYNRDVVRIVLQSQGFSVTDYEDSKKAAVVLDTQTFDLLVLDLQMPGLDGRAILRRIQPNPIHSQMQIIVVTAYAHMDTAEIQQQAHYVMYKPLDITNFAAFTHRILSGLRPSLTLPPAP